MHTRRLAAGSAISGYPDGQKIARWHMEMASRYHQTRGPREQGELSYRKVEDSRSRGGQVRYKLLTPALSLLALVLLTGTALAAILCSGECTGTNMGDRLIGGTEDDIIYSRTGNDRARGGAGKDFIK